MTKLQLQDTMVDVVSKMSEGNFGAIRVCTELMEADARIDPDAMLAGIGPLLGLDTLGIYGSRIWMLYKDVCGEDITNTLAVLRAHQLGQLDTTTLMYAIDNYGDGIDCVAVLTGVQERLPRFGAGI